ncbi:VPS10 domain-containing protein [Sandarakinorhabdus sp.]|uniref:VPS10 domain-containing protein n=1 Tax=Sandarakinorhabdus sp. TaxID=1916663 RepID=UPI003F716442
MRAIYLAGVAAAAVLGTAAGWAQPASTPAPTPAPTGVEAYFGGLKWRNIGPARGGRSISAVGSVARPNEYWFAATGGGLWKTVDGGVSWQPQTDGKVDTAAFGGVAVCEANPDIVYATTGEAQLRGNILPGNGVWKTSDGGKTWAKIGLEKVQNFSRVRIHPKNCDTVFVGGFGHYGADNEDRGLFRTTDGGKNWTKTLYRDAKTGAVDISIDPTNPDVVYAALWEAWRKPWGMSSGGPGSGLFKSTDGGSNWTEISRAPGLPKDGLLGKIGVSVSPADPTRVYAIIEHEAAGGVYASNDGGQSWEKRNESRDLRQRAFYYTRIQADPKDKDRVYVLNVNFFRSDDGGKTFPKKIKVPHGDNHDLWIAADNNQRMIQANDGGANVSVNGGTSWTRQDFSTAQIYRLALTGHQPAFACGGQQDNTTICVPVRGHRHQNVLGGAYGFAAGGGESGYVASDPRNPDIFYAGSYGGLLTRYDHKTGLRRVINVRPDNPIGYSAGDIAERFQWTFPVVFDPHDPGALYVTSQHVWRSRNEGQSWEKISPDLTAHDPTTLGPSGGPITLDQTGVETYATIFALAPSRREQGVIWAGSDDGLVHISRDGGATWANITPPAMPKFAKITTVEDSPHSPGTAYVVAHRFLMDDFSPIGFKTTDYGKSWTPITTGLPAGEMLRSIREDTVRPGLLYLATERGVRVSFDGGGAWHNLQAKLPDVQVSDLAVSGQDLVIATHGRGFWVMDNAGLLRQVPADIKSGATPATRLFTPAMAQRGLDPGVAIDYHLAAAPKALAIEILDSAGTLIQRYEGKVETTKQEAAKAQAAKTDSAKLDPQKKPTPTADAPNAGGAAATGGDDDEEDGPPKKPTATMKPGMNRFTWNMRHPGYTSFDGMIFWAAGNGGVAALPGNYRARLIVDGKPFEQPFNIGPDPRAQATPDALKARFDLAQAVTARVNEANNAVLLVRGIRAQVDALAKGGKPVPAAVPALMTRLSAIEAEIYQVKMQSRQDPLNYPIKLNNKLAALIGIIESAEAPPTEGTRVVFADLSAQLDVQLKALEAALAEGLPAANAALKAAGMAALERKPLPPGDNKPVAGDDAAGQKLW